MDKDGKVDYNEFIQATINHQANLNKKTGYNDCQDKNDLITNCLAKYYFGH